MIVRAIPKHTVTYEATQNNVFHVSNGEGLPIKVEAFNF